MKEKISIDKVVAFMKSSCVGQEAARDPGSKTPPGPREHRHTLRSAIVPNNFITYHKSDEPKQRLALVFELMERNMYEHIKERKQPLEEKRVKKYLYQLIKGLEFIHRQGIFHRDIKP